MDAKEDDIRTTPWGNTYEMVDDFKEQRKELLGKEGPLPLLTKIALAELLTNGNVPDLDERVDIDTLREAVEILTVQADLRADQEWEEETKAKDRARNQRR